MGRRRHHRIRTAEEVAQMAEQRRVVALLALCPSDMPAAQRNADLIVAVEAPKHEHEVRTATETVRRLTRVERMQRAGVLEPHEAKACEWYAEITALAWDTVGCTASYEGARGSRQGASDPLIAKNQAVADARADYADATSFMVGSWRAIFEALVCRNEALGPVAAVAFPDLGRSQAEYRARRVVKLYANKLHERYGVRMGWGDAPVVAVAAVAKPQPVVVANTQIRISEELSAAIDARAGTSEIWMASAVAAEIGRELGLSADEELASYAGLPVVLRDRWRWGWVLVGAEAMAA